MTGHPDVSHVCAYRRRGRRWVCRICGTTKIGMGRMAEPTMPEHVHVKSAPPFGCLITKDEAAELAGRSTRTIELWAEQGLITKFTVGPTGYWVRFCQVEVKAVMDPVPVGRGLIDGALARIGTPSASAAGGSG